MKVDNVNFIIVRDKFNRKSDIIVYNNMPVIKKSAKKVKKNSNISLENKETQTENETDVQQLADLQQQLISLQLENCALRDIIVAQAPTHSPNVSLKPSNSLDTLASLKSSAKKWRCTCKGKCGTKNCGCVKRQQPCGNLCKCSHQTCKNQPQIEDKENININSQRETVQSLSIKTEVISPIVSHWEENENNVQDFMKPKHELPRTPPQQNIDRSVQNDSSGSPVASSSFESSIRRVSDIVLPIPCNLNVDDDVEEAPSDELLHDLSTPQVDWNNHKSKLVECRKCGRPFWPHRVKKHETCCKKV